MSWTSVNAEGLRARGGDTRCTLYGIQKVQIQPLQKSITTPTTYHPVESTVLEQTMIDLLGALLEFLAFWTGRALSAKKRFIV